MAGFKSGSSNGDDDFELESEINIIPLVDIMLVLLIIFMVAAPLMSDSVDVRLPKAKAKAAGVKEQSVIVSIDQNKNLFIGKTEIKKDDLAKKLQSIFANRERKELFIKADRKVEHGFVIQVMAEVQRSGVYKIAFMTDPTP